MTMSAPKAPSLAAPAPGHGAEAMATRVDQLDWAQVHADLDAQGWTIAHGFLTHPEADCISGPL